MRGIAAPRQFSHQRTILVKCDQCRLQRRLTLAKASSLAGQPSNLSSQKRASHGSQPSRRKPRRCRKRRPRGKRVTANITILALPPKSPELNPVENIWHIGLRQWAHVFLRDQARQADRSGADQSYVPRRYFRRQALMHLPG